MAAIILVPGTHVATIPITVVPGGDNCSVGIILTSDSAGNNIVAQSSQTGFTSSGVMQNVAASLSVPAGNCYVWVNVVINGNPVGAFAQGNTIVGQSVAVGTITWS